MVRILLTAVLVLFIGACGSDSASSNSCSSTASSASNANSAAVTTYGFSSPLASCTSSNTSLLSNMKPTFASLLNLFDKLIISYIKATPRAAAATDIKTAVNTAKDIVAVLDATSAAGCVAGIGALTASVNTVDCYGPGINYTNHPDHGTPNSNTGSLPTGDLGLYTSAEADGEACSAAKSNAVVQSVSDSINGGLKMAAAVACLLNVQGTALPTSGTSANMASAWNAATNVSGLTITTATIAFVSTGKYTTTVTGSGALNGAFSIVLTNTKTDDSTSSGRMYGYYTPNGTPRTLGFSVVYSRAGGVLTAVAKSGEDSTGASTTFFDGSNNFDYTQAASNMNEYYNLVSVSESTGLGTIYSAWQAGSGDSHSRVFNANTSKDSGGNDVGFAYFGYGPKVTEAGVGTINRMICNWAGPNSSHTGLSNKAQGQSLARNSSGIFTTSGDRITYAVTNSCDNSSSSFQMAKTGATQAAVGTVVNNLVTVGDLGTVPTVTVPTY